MNKREKIIISGVGAILAYLFLRRRGEKKLSISEVHISPTEFFV